MAGDGGDVGVRITGEGDVGDDAGFAPGVVDAAEGERYAGGEGDAVAAGFPAFGAAAGAFRCHDQDAVRVAGEAFDHLVDEAGALAAIDRDAAEAL